MALQRLGYDRECMDYYMDGSLNGRREDGTAPMFGLFEDFNSIDAGAALCSAPRLDDAAYFLMEKHRAFCFARPEAPSGGIPSMEYGSYVAMIGSSPAAPEAYLHRAWYRAEHLGSWPSYEAALERAVKAAAAILEGAAAAESAEAAESAGEGGRGESHG